MGGHELWSFARLCGVVPASAVLPGPRGGTAASSSRSPPSSCCALRSRRGAGARPMTDLRFAALALLAAAAGTFLVGVRRGLSPPGPAAPVPGLARLGRVFAAEAIAIVLEPVPPARFVAARRPRRPRGGALRLGGAREPARPLSPRLRGPGSRAPPDARARTRSCGTRSTRATCSDSPPGSWRPARPGSSRRSRSGSTRTGARRAREERGFERSPLRDEYRAYARRVGHVRPAALAARPATLAVVRRRGAGVDSRAAEPVGRGELASGPRGTRELRRGVARRGAGTPARTPGSNCEPLQRRSSSSASRCSMPTRYGRSLVIASYVSQTARMRGERPGSPRPARPVRVAGAVEALVVVEDRPRDALELLHRGHDPPAHLRRAA